MTAGSVTVPQGPLRLMYRVYRYILPEVKKELGAWRTKAEQIPDQELRKQALASIQTKEFHCQGGSVYAAANLDQRHVLIPLIVALQTISDYLDNLCDRSTSLDPEDFRRLHQSMLDAVNPDWPMQDYYAFRTEKDDGAYLAELVQTCRRCVQQLPSYGAVREQVSELVGYYADLQVYKHIHHDLREGELLRWWEKHQSRHAHLSWNEFAAATGSTLGMFTLFLAASKPGLTRERAVVIRGAYFPHICALHILLDYLIDQEEDLQGGDLNFCNYYGNREATAARIAAIVEHARADINRMQDSNFHRMVIEGLLALYLSDPKVSGQSEVRAVTRQLMKNSPLSRLFFWMNSVWIRKTGSSGT
ncbi:tetraprenyl-beta-curcumene synthase [Paenibacillus swuensis]|uniref:Tetraprenyl-beta-curcumene synthase n=1 Tax=Paenibacillus swuensis TaxID=1178515 RepID=A0A172TPS3_9BACL|nr:tetraprenyl-beta-curcumene synthase family protein [Paenibacillus swuensis]ANE49079.1 tetraprenyl-beta-curcumene synthase [Paenibacillus swuensis]